MVSALSFNKVGFSYEDDIIFKNISFNVKQGEYVSIIGSNGVGKSTLIKLALGMLKPVKGSICIWEKPLLSFKDWSSIGYIPQRADFNQAFPATVEEIVGLKYPSALFSMQRKIRTEKVSQVLESVGLSKKRKALISSLSGGQMQRVLIAKALVTDPEMLFLDEPTIGIDIENLTKLHKLLNHLNSQGMTIIMATHDHNFAKNTITKTLIVDNYGISDKQPVYHVG